MSGVIKPDQIKSRLQGIGMSQLRLARRSGVTHATLSRILGGLSGGRCATMMKLGDALRYREIELRDYLLGLHPLAPSPVALSPVSLREPALPGGSDDVAALASARPARGEMEDTKLEAAE